MRILKNSIAFIESVQKSFLLKYFLVLMTFMTWLIIMDYYFYTVHNTVPLPWKIYVVVLLITVILYLIKPALIIMLQQKQMEELENVTNKSE